MEIKLEAGRDLDKMVSEKLGHQADWHYKDRPPFCDCKELMYSTGPDIRDYETVPEYSTSWDAAGELVEWIKIHITENITILFRDKRDDSDLTCRVDIEADYDYAITLSSAWADTLPHAVCRAFLNLPDEVISNVNP